TIPAKLVAAAVSLKPEDIVTKTHDPQIASVGLPFLMTELKDLSALERARANGPGIEALLAEDIRPSMYLYTRGPEPTDVRARMFAPLSGVPEDPATGSAGCAVAGLLTHFAEQSSGAFRYRITQGVEMGRPSTLIARAQKNAGKVEATWIGGACVLISEGQFYVD